MDKKLIKILMLLTMINIFIFDAKAFNFKDNFETYTSAADLRSNWSEVPKSNYFTIDPTGGYGGGRAIKFIYLKGSHGMYLNKNMSTAGSPEVYVKCKVKFGTGATGGIKFLKIFGVIKPGPSYANWTWNFGPTTAKDSYLSTLCHGSGSGLVNDTDACLYLPSKYAGNSYGTIAISNNKLYPKPGQWYEIKTYNKYNKDGNHDGEMWMEIDGVPFIHVTGSRNRNDDNPRIIERVSFGDYANPNANITMWLDDIEISDKLIFP